MSEPTKPTVTMTFEVTRAEYTPATPVQAAAYEERLKADPVSYPRELQRRGELTKAAADEMVRAARTERRRLKAKRKAGGRG